MRSNRTLALGAAGGGVVAAATAIWWRRHRDDRPYGPRWIAEAPRPGLSRRRLAEVLRPQPGERLLEVGPGYGYYTASIAGALGPAGSLAILDVREALLDQTMARVAAAGLTNVAPERGDGQRLPYPDGRFDAAFLVATLGEIDDHAGAVRELARVLRRGGRLVVGESAVDPHRVHLTALAEHARRAGLEPGPTVGRRGYFARFEKPDLQ